MRHAKGIALGLCVLLCGCAPMPGRDGVLEGEPIDQFVDDLKSDLAQVHWRVRGDRPACGSAAPREVDLRDAAVVLTLKRTAQASIGGDVRLVALPLGNLGVEPLLSGDYERNSAATLVMKLEVDGSAPVHEPGARSAATGPVAQALNAAIDGFMRSQAQQPCVRLTSLKLTLVLDVERNAGAGFRITVPAVRVDGALGSGAVNTLTLEWAHVASNGFL
jgi:hypothetical protein